MRRLLISLLFAASAFAQTHIGVGCTTAYYIDKDCDGYGVGKKLSGNYPLGVGVTAVGGDKPDADDTDPAINTPATWTGSYTLLQMLATLGYTPARIWYVDIVSGNNATGLVNDITKPFRDTGAVASAYRDNAGGAIVIRAGTYTLPLGGCHSGFPCYFPSASSPSNPLLIIAYPGERVEIYNAGPFSPGFSYWPNKAGDNVILDGLIFRSSSPTAGYGLKFADYDDVTIRNCEYLNYNDGIFAGNHTKDMLVEQSVFHDNNHHDFYLGSSGMTSYGAADFDFVNDETKYGMGTSPGASYRVTFRSNVIYNSGNSGYEPIHINSYARDVVIEKNIVHSSGGTGVGFQSGIYYSYIQNNLIFNNAKCGITFYLYGPGTQAATIRYNYILNNTIWVNLQTGTMRNAAPNCGVEMADGGSASGHWIKDTTIRNNIIMTHSDSFQYGAPIFRFGRNSFPHTHLISNNLFYSVGTNPSAVNRVMEVLTTAQGHASGNYTFADFEAYNVNFNNNRFANPDLVDALTSYSTTPHSFNLRVLPSSPAIDTGSMTNEPTDILGISRVTNAPPDIGAYEYEKPAIDDLNTRIDAVKEMIQIKVQEMLDALESLKE